MKILPETDTKFWCRCCDANVVHHQDKNSGRFFHIFGEIFGRDEDGSLYFAICWECLPKLSEWIKEQAI